MPMFQTNGDVQNCSSYRVIKLIIHTMRIWERVVETWLREEVMICEQQYGFMVRESTINIMFALKMLVEKYRI